MRTPVFLLQAFLVMALLWSRTALANDITITSFKANQSTSSLAISANGTLVDVQATLERPKPNSSGSEAYVAFYILKSAPVIGSKPGATTADNSSPKVGGVPTTSGGFWGSWEDHPTNSAKSIFRLQRPAFQLSASSPGMGTFGDPGKLYMVLVDPSEDKIIYTFTGIPIALSAPTASITNYISPGEGRVGTQVTIRGAGYEDAYAISFNSTTNSSHNLELRNFGRSSDGSISFIIPASVVPDIYNIGVTLKVNNQLYSPYSFNRVRFVVLPSTAPTTAPQLTEIRKENGQGNIVTINAVQGTVFQFYNIIGVSFGGLISTKWTYHDSYPYALTVEVPAGISYPLGLQTGAIKVLTSVGESNAVFLPQHPTPFGDTPIGKSQYVAYGSLPNLIEGRVLADWYWAEFRDYYNAFLSGPNPYTYPGYYPTKPFAEGSRKEFAQWQYSYTGNENDWHDIDGNATGRNFQPWPCYQTTYYRRLSSEILENFWNQEYRRHWYASNVVTITPSSPPPTPTQSTYYACPGSTFTINFTHGDAATSTNWSLPTLDWRINGTGTGVNYGPAFTVQGATSVQITVPANFPLGSYEVHASSNGPAGTAGYRVIPVVVGNAESSSLDGPTQTSSNLTYTYSVIGGGNNGNNYIWTLPSGWYLRNQNGNTAIIQPPAYNSQGEIAVDFIDNCGTSAHVTLQVSNNECNGCLSERNAGGNSQAFYPNPATDEITLMIGKQDAEVTFYDAHGVERKAIKSTNRLRGDRVNVSDLPAGLYHVRVVRKGQPLLEKQLLIQR